MAFSTSFIFEAIDKVSNVLEKIDKAHEKTSKKFEKNNSRMSKSLERLGKVTKKVSAKVGKMGNRMKGAGENVSGVGSAMSKASILFSGGVALISNAGSKYETALASLQAITGVTNDELKFMDKGIMKLSKQFGLGSADIAKGMELIGSNQPELLTNPKLLLDVAKNASFLAKASGMTLAESGNNLTKVMNQFSLGGEHSERTMNALASASKVGSANVGDVVETLKNVGTVASEMAKIPLEQTLGAIEAISGKLKGAEAGTGLRTVFAQLEKQTNDKFKPSIVGLDKALANLEKANLSNTKLFKLFGTEGIVVGKTLISNREKVVSMTKAITGSNTGFEQANINMKAFGQRFTKGMNQVRIAMIKAFNILRPSLIGLMTFFGKIVDRMTKFMEENKGLTKVLFFLGSALAVVTPLVVGLGASITFIGGAIAVLTPLFAKITIAGTILFAKIALIVGAIATVLYLLSKLSVVRTFFRTLYAVSSPFLEVMFDIGKTIAGMIFGLGEGTDKMEKFSKVGFLMAKGFAVGFAGVLMLVNSLIEKFTILRHALGDITDQELESTIMQTADTSFKLKQLTSDRFWDKQQDKLMKSYTQSESRAKVSGEIKVSASQGSKVESVNTSTKGAKGGIGFTATGAT